MIKHKGFSLVEIAIVLAIIGLIAGSITIGINLKKQYELKSLMEKTFQLSIAYNQFKEIYNESPGDMWNADQILGTAISFNGNGNSYINIDNDESTFAPIHLSAARLITGTYSGSWDLTAIPSAIPGNYINNILYFASISRAAAGDRTIFDGSTRENLITVATYKDINNNGTIEFINENTLSVLTPLDMHYIDHKFDDGIPNTGIILSADGIESIPGSCVNATTFPYSYNAADSITCYFGLIVNKKSN